MSTALSIELSLDDSSGDPVAVSPSEERKKEPEVVKVPEGVSTPTLLGEESPRTPASAETNVEHPQQSGKKKGSSYVKSLDRSRSTYQSAQSSNSKKQRNLSKERLKNSVSPGALRQSLAQDGQRGETKWSLTRRMQMQLGLDLRRVSASSASSSSTEADSVESRRTVKVSTRVRHFSRAERKAGAKRVVSVNGNTLSVIKSDLFADAEAETVVAAAEVYRNSRWSTTFGFDSVHWAVEDDAHAVEQLPPPDSSSTGTGGSADGAPVHRSTQEGVYQDVGSELVDNVLNGFSSACFAYGAKESGRSYTMFGSNGMTTNGMGIEVGSKGAVTLLKSAGLAPRALTEIVSAIRSAKDTSEDTAITLSMAEVTHERAFDLLSSASSSPSSRPGSRGPELEVAPSNAGSTEDNSNNKSGGERGPPLKLREHPDRGPYIEGLRCATVRTPADVLRLLEEGLRRRTENTRAGGVKHHCVVTLELTPSRPAAAALSPANSGSPESAVVPRGGNSSPVIEPSTPAKPYGSITPRPQSPAVAGTAAACVQPVRLQMVELGEAYHVSSSSSSSSSAAAVSSNSSSSSSSETTSNGDDAAIRRAVASVGYILGSLRSGGSNGNSRGYGGAAHTLPYRECGLTWLLRDTLCSPGHIAVIAAVSPAQSCHDETMATLQFAARICNGSSYSGDEGSEFTAATDPVSSAISPSYSDNNPENNNPGVDMSRLSVATRDTLSDLAVYNQELERIQAGLGANKPGSDAARALLQAELSDPRQKAGKMTTASRGHESSSSSSSYRQMDFSSPAGVTDRSGAVISQPNTTPGTLPLSLSPAALLAAAASPASPALSGGASPALIAIGDIGTRSLSAMREKHSRLRAEHIELEIELDQCRTDRDSVALLLQVTQNRLREIEQKSQPSPRSKESIEELGARLARTTRELAALEAVVASKEDAIDRLYDEIKAEREHRNEVEVEADRVVALLRGHVEVLQQELSLQQQQEQQRLQQGGSGSRVSAEAMESVLHSTAMGDGDGNSSNSVLVQHLSEQLIRTRLELETRDAEVFALHEKVSEAASSTSTTSSDGAGSSATQAINEAKAQLQSAEKQRVSLQAELEAERAAHTAAVQEVSMLTTKLRAATSLPPASPSLTSNNSRSGVNATPEPGTPSSPRGDSPALSMGDMERSSLERMIATQEATMEQRQQAWEAMRREQAVVVAAQAAEISSLSARLAQDSDERAQAQQRAEADIDLLRGKEQDLKRRVKTAEHDVGEAHEECERLRKEVQASATAQEQAVKAAGLADQERGMLERVVKTQESTIRLLQQQQQQQQQQGSQIEAASDNVRSSREEEKKEKKEEKEKARKTEAALSYYKALCAKQKEYIARMEANIAAMAAQQRAGGGLSGGGDGGVEEDGEGMEQPSSPHTPEQSSSPSSSSSYPDTPSLLGSPAASPQQHALTLERLRAAEAKATYWQELAQRSGAKNASNFTANNPPSLPSPSRGSQANPNLSPMGGAGSNRGSPSRGNSSSNSSSSRFYDQRFPPATGDGGDGGEEPQATAEQLAELAELKQRLAQATAEREQMAQDMVAAKSNMKQEYTSLWAAVQDLNRLDATKEKAIGALLEERVRSDKKLTRAQMQYQRLQDELSTLDTELLTTARAEGLLGSIDPVRTPHLAQKLSFDNDNDTTAAISSRGNSTSGAAVLHKISAPTMQEYKPLQHQHQHQHQEQAPKAPQAHYLQDTVATHGWAWPNPRPHEDANTGGAGAGAGAGAGGPRERGDSRGASRGRSKSPTWKPPGSTHSNSNSSSGNANNIHAGGGNMHASRSFDSGNTSQGRSRSSYSRPQQQQRAGVNTSFESSRHSPEPPRGRPAGPPVQPSPYPHPVHPMAQHQQQKQKPTWPVMGGLGHETEAERELRMSLSELDHRLSSKQTS